MTTAIYLMCMHVHYNVRSLRNVIYFIEYALGDRNATSFSKLEASRHSFHIGDSIRLPKCC